LKNNNNGYSYVLLKLLAFSAMQAQNGLPICLCSQQCR